MNEQGHATVQKYPDGTPVPMNGQEWTIEQLVCRDGENLLPGQEDRGEGYTLYRLTRHQTKAILRWQHEIDAALSENEGVILTAPEQRRPPDHA